MNSDLPLDREYKCQLCNSPLHNWQPSKKANNLLDKQGNWQKTVYENLEGIGHES
jgi:hypothetical protein